MRVFVRGWVGELGHPLADDEACEWVVRGKLTPNEKPGTW